MLYESKSRGPGHNLRLQPTLTQGANTRRSLHSSEFPEPAKSAFQSFRSFKVGYMVINPVMADTPTRSPKGPWKCPGKDACPTVFYNREVKNGLLSGAPRAGHEWQAPKGCFCAEEERSHLLLEGERPSENCKVVRTCQWGSTPAAASTNERAALHLSDQYVSGVGQRGARIAGNGRGLPVRWEVMATMVYLRCSPIGR